MYPRRFEYFCAVSLAEALSLLSQYGELARVLAGGQSLIPLMKLRLASPEYVIDLNRTPGLSYIKEVDSHIALGALTRHVEVEESALLRSRLPIINDAARVIGDVQVRNMGTVGGALAHAEPAGDWGPLILALNAQIKVVGSKGERALAASNLFLDAYTTALNHDEILTEVSIPLPPPRSAGAYLKMVRRAGDLAVVGLAVQLSMNQKGECQDVGIGIGGAAPTPIKATKAEEALKGEKMGDAVIQEAALKASQEADPFSDIRGTAEYRRELVKVLTRRALTIAMGRIRGEAMEAGYV